MMTGYSSWTFPPSATFSSADPSHLGAPGIFLISAVYKIYQQPENKQEKYLEESLVSLSSHHNQLVYTVVFGFCWIAISHTGAIYVLKITYFFSKGKQIFLFIHSEFEEGKCQGLESY